MITSIVNPIDKIGSLHIRPNWRYELLTNPAKYKMQGFVSTPGSDSTCLRRFLQSGLEFEVNYKFPTYLKELTVLLDDEERLLFEELWRKSFNESDTVRLSISTDPVALARNPVWNLSKVAAINDDFLKRLIYHHSNYKYDAHIKYALDLARSPEHNEIFRFIGYGVYCKLTDQQLAKRWRLPVKHIEAIREIFYDFSRFPTDRVANFTYLRQLANIGVISDVDFTFFKRAFELGDLGIRAIVDYTGLSDQDRRTVEDFLGKSVIANTLSLNFTVKTYKDAVNYGMVVSNLASYYIKQKESAYFDAKIRNLDAVTRRIEGDLVSGDDVSDLDKEMLELLREHSLKEVAQIEYKTLADLRN